MAGAGGGPLQGWSLLDVSYVGLAAAVVKASAVIMLTYSETRLAGRVADRARAQVVSALLNFGLHDAAPRVHATIAVRVRELEACVESGVLGSIRAMAQLLPLALALIILSPPLALAGTLGLLPFGVGLAALRRRWRSESAKAQGLSEELHAGVDELVINVDLFRSYGAGSVIERALLALAERATAAGARVDAARAALSGGNEVLAALFVVGVVALAPRYGVVLGDGMLIAFCALLFMAYRPLRELGDARAACLRGSVALEALEQVKREGRQPPPARQVESDSFRLVPLELTGLGAERGGPRTTARIEPGEVVCVVGKTGSGKTTLLRVLLGLEPAVGRLRYANIDITDAPVGPRARPFAWVPQDAPLVTGTLLFNVALLGGSPRSAREALQTIGAECLFESLGDTPIGPGARPLSGGERRQVAIARALCSGLPVLLLDEPSEGLDEAARLQVLRALELLRGRRSVIVVTHRRELAACADRIVHLGA